MKKIFTVTNWDTTAFSADNVAGQTHWMVKALAEVITAMGLTPTFSYKSATAITLSVDNYGTFDIYRPTQVNATSYIIYADSENLELFACSSMDAAASNAENKFTGTQSKCNYARGLFLGSTSTSISSVGGYLALKFADGAIVGTSSANKTQQFVSGPNITHDSIGISLGQRNEALLTPLTAVNVKYERCPIYEHFYSNDMKMWTGERFNSIYATDVYYLGALKNEDNTQFYYGGYLFDVDDATDIGVIDTAI